jgi:hypothetical protein
MLCPTNFGRFGPEAVIHRYESILIHSSNGNPTYVRLASEACAWRPRAESNFPYRAAQIGNNRRSLLRQLDWIVAFISARFTRGKAICSGDFLRAIMVGRVTSPLKPSSDGV